jgi:putative transcriptional regulator
MIVKRSLFSALIVNIYVWICYWLLKVNTMIKCHLSRFLGEKRLKVMDVSRDTGLNKGTLYRLYNETAERIDLDTIDKLCIYLDCEVGELLEYQKP